MVWQPNKIYGDDIYNRDIKEMFINGFDVEGTRKNYLTLFKNSYGIEKALDKDIADMGLDELEYVLSSFAPKTIKSAKTKLSMLYGYINWAIKNGIRKSQSNINPLDVVKIDVTKFLEKFVVKDISQYLTENDLTKGEYQIENAQDYVILRALFEGIGGPGLSELTNLKITDVNFDNNTVNLITGRTIKISEKLVKAIDEANKQTVYLTRNGDGEGNTTSRELIPSAYVLKNALVSKINAGEKVSKATIYQRIRMIGQIVYNRKNLTATNIQKSGQIYMGKVLLDQYGKLDKEQYLQLSEQFNITKDKTGMYQWYLLKEYVNEDHIKALYG